MKSILFTLIAAVFLLSCNQDENFVHKPAVTTTTTAAFTVNYLTNQHIITNVEKVVMDTFAFVSVDSSTQKRQWRRDSFYYFIQLDTMRNKGAPVFDSTGRVVFTQSRVPLKKEHVLIDYNKNWPRP